MLTPQTPGKWPPSSAKFPAPEPLHEISPTATHTARADSWLRTRENENTHYYTLNSWVRDRKGAKRQGRLIGQLTLSHVFNFSSELDIFKFKSVMSAWTSWYSPPCRVWVAPLRWTCRLWKDILRSLITSTQGQKVIVSCPVTQALNLTANLETPLEIVIRSVMFK